MAINRQLFEVLGMTLIDSLWQGALVMSVAFLGLWLMKKSKASLRHNFLLICILALPILGIHSFTQRFEREIATVETAAVSNPIVMPFERTQLFPEVSSTPTVVENESFAWVDMIHWIGVLWVVGLVLIFVRSIGAYVYLHRLKSEASPIAEKTLISLFKRLKEGFDLKKTVLLKESEKISSPMVYGYFKPVILFPLGLIQGLTIDEVEAILLHELAHLKRNDFLINIIINGLRAVYFYHPVFWWLQSQLDNEREFASDEIVMERKTDGLVLVRALTKAQEFSMLSPSIGFAGSSKHQLLKRVNRIMKKQQKPNWAGLLLPCAILLSVFLLSSQSDSKKQETESVVNQSDTMKVRRSFKLPTEEEIQNAKLEYIDSLGNRHVSFVNDQTDTVSVAQATMELLENPSPVSVTVSMGDGMPVGFSKNGRTIKGDEFKVYEEAYLKLNKYSSNAADKRMSGFMGEKTPGIHLRGSGLAELNKLEKQLAKEKELRDKMILDLTKNPNPSAEQIKAVPLQVNKVDQLEEIVMKMKANATDTQKAKFREIARQNNETLQSETRYQRLIVIYNQAKIRAEAERIKLDAEIVKASRDSTKADSEAIIAQAKRVAALEEQLEAAKRQILNGRGYSELAQKTPKRQEELIKEQASPFDARLAFIIDSSYFEVEDPLYFSLGQEEKSQRQKLLETAQMAEQQNKDLIRVTAYSDDDKLYEFPRGKESVVFAIDAFKPIKTAGKNPIFEINGVLRPEAKFSDLNQEDIVSMRVLSGKLQMQRYPNGETDGRDVLILVFTSQLESKISNNIRYTNNGKSIDEKGSTIALDEYVKMENNGDLPILEVDGVLMPSARMSDIIGDDIYSFVFSKGKLKEKTYPNGETKGRKAIYILTTFNGMKRKLLKMGSHQMNFKSTFTEQIDANQIIEGRLRLFDNPVVVFNGKAMPDNYLLKYTDAYIKTINILKGEAIKKYPKRKLRDRGTIIEVITEKTKTTKN